MQNLSECWSSVRDKVEFAEHGKLSDVLTHDSKITEMLQQGKPAVATPSVLSSSLVSPCS